MRYLIIIFSFFCVKFALAEDVRRFEIAKIVKTCQEQDQEKVQTLIDDFFDGFISKKGVGLNVAIGLDSAIKVLMPGFSFYSDDKLINFSIDTSKVNIDCNNQRVAIEVPTLDATVNGLGFIKAGDVSVNLGYERSGEDFLITDVAASAKYFALNYVGDNPVDFKVEGLKYSSVLKKYSDYHNFLAKINLKSLKVDGNVFGSVDVDVEIDKLPALAYEHLTQCLIESASKLEECKKLFFGDLPSPTIKINNVFAKTKDGDVKISGFFSKESVMPLVQSGALVASVPRAVIKAVALSGCISKFSEGTQGVQKADIKFLCSKFVNDQVSKLIKNKTILENAGILSFKMALKDDVAIINGKKIKVSQ